MLEWVDTLQVQTAGAVQFLASVQREVHLRHRAHSWRESPSWKGEERGNSLVARERESWLMRFDLFSEGFYSSKLQNAFVNMATCVCQNGKIYSTEFLEEELGNRFVARERAGRWDLALFREKLTVTGVWFCSSPARCWSCRKQDDRVSEFWYWHKNIYI